MNDSQTQIDPQMQRSERIASKILRALAIIGLVAVLALASWVIVRGARNVPAINETLNAAVIAVQNVLRTAPEESLTLELENQTFTVNDKTVITWSYVGETAPEEYAFSYSCGTPATLAVIDESGWKTLDCEEVYTTLKDSIVISAENTDTRIADIEITVTGNELTDTAAVTVINTDIITETASASHDTSSGKESTEDEQSTNETTVTENTSSASTNSTQSQATAGRSTQTVVRRTTPVYTGPADLVLEIKETGIILDVDGEDTFFPIDTIPTDKVAGVVFTVTNKGGETSEIWNFTASLPIEGDDEYEYESPKQIPLASGMEIEFTLGFDEVLEEDEGTITIELDPNNRDDKTSNNKDSVDIEIDIK